MKEKEKGPSSPSPQAEPESAEEHGYNVVRLYYNTGKARPEDEGQDRLADLVTHEVRAAEAAARKQAFEEAARWHEEQQKRANSGRAEVTRGDSFWYPPTKESIVHRDSAAHFRSLAAPQEGE